MKSLIFTLLFSLLASGVWAQGKAEKAEASKAEPQVIYKYKKHITHCFKRNYLYDGAKP